MSQELSHGGAGRAILPVYRTLLYLHAPVICHAEFAAMFMGA